MGVADKGGIRAGDADRDSVVRLLQRHYQAGRLTVTELEERTQQAFAARTLGDLAPVMADLPEEAAPPARPAAAPGPATVECGRGGGRPFSRQLASFGVTMLGLVAIWALTGHGYFWPVWPMLGWGMGLASRGLRGGSDRSRRRFAASRW